MVVVSLCAVILRRFSFDEAMNQRYSAASKVDAKKDLIALYHDAETYAQSSALFETLAVVTPDGKWHKPGKMAWFGLISETDSELREWREK